MKKHIFIGVFTTLLTLSIIAQTAIPKVVVPPGDVGFVIANQNDQAPILTEREAAVRAKLQMLGYTKITYIGFDKVANTDFTQARFVIAAEKSTLTEIVVNSLIEQGKGVALLYDAATPLGGSWEYDYDSADRSLLVEKGEAFLKGYAADVPAHMQVEQNAAFIYKNYPSNWVVLGRNASDNPYKTAFYQLHPNGGKGAIFTYDPRYYSSAGDDFFALLINWIAENPILEGITVPAGNVAFVTYGFDDQTPTLTDKEAAVSEKLKALGYRITYIRSSRVKASDFSKARFIIAADYPALDADTINALIEGQKGVALLYDAGAPLGGRWKYDYDERDRRLLVELGESFLAGYATNVSALIQSQSYAAFLYRGYPFGWTVLGRNTSDDTYKTAFYQQHPSGGKGVVFTYNPQYYSSAGDNLFVRLIEWVAENPIVERVTVPAGDVAFVISGFDDQTPELTSVELAVSELLKGLGYKLTYIRSSKAHVSDFSKANFVIATKYPTLDKDTVNALIEQGKGVALLYSAAAPLGGTWDFDYDRSDRSLFIENGISFLNGYFADLSFEMQPNGYAGYITRGYPFDWNPIGRNTSDDAYKTIFYRQSATGKGVIFTYNPQGYSPAGKNMFAKLVEWIAEKPILKGVTVPEGNVAFVIEGYDEQGPSLTSKETVLKDRIESLGYKITYIRSSRVTASDLSKARFIVATHYPTLDVHTINSLIEKGKRLALLYTAAGPVGGNWAIAYNSSDRRLHIETGEAFLKGYATSNIWFDMQSEGYAAYIHKNYPSEWKNLGSNGRDNNAKTAFYREHGSGGRGAIFTYNPEYYSWVGENLFAKMVEWLADPPILMGIAVPQGDVAFITTGPDDVTLTDSEKSIRVKLESLGHRITFIRFSRLTASDFSKAKFIIAAHYPTLDANTINALIESGKGVVMLYDAGAPLGGTWEYNSSGVDYQLNVEAGEAFLKGYGAHTVQSGRYAASLVGNYPEDWKALGSSNRDINHKTAFYREHASSGRGAIFTYYPQYYTADGDKIFSSLVDWAVQTPTIIKPPATPALVAPADNEILKTLSPTLSWATVSGALSYRIQIAKDDKFTQLVVQADISDTKYVVPSEKINDFEIYYWRVAAHSAVGASDWTLVRKFKIMTEFPRWDVNADGVVDILDLVLVGLHFGEDYRTLQAIAKNPLELASNEKVSIWLSVNGKVKSEGILRLDVKTDKIANLYGYQFDLAFDPNVLQVIGIRASNLLSADNAPTYWSVSQIDDREGRIRGVTHVRQATTKGVTVYGTLATVVFKVVQKTPKGQMIFNLDNVQMVDSKARRFKILTSTFVAKAEELFVPDVSALFQNFPNPFNPETWLPYQIADDALVTIAIYNPKGQLIRVINLGNQSAGVYVTKGRAVYWDGKDNAGEKVASGVYFYTIQAGDFGETRKMVMAR